MNASREPVVLGTTAGFASRTAAMLIDIVVIAATFYGGLVLVTLTVQVLRVRHLDVASVPTDVVGYLLAGWTAVYFWVAWWGFAKTAGKAIIGLRVVTRRGGTVTWPRALARLGGYAVSIATLGLGFAWVAVDRERRGWHDLLAGTRVVYDWREHGAHLDTRERTVEAPPAAAGSSDAGDDFRPVEAPCSSDVGVGRSRSR